MNTHNHPQNKTDLKRLFQYETSPFLKIDGLSNRGIYSLVSASHNNSNDEDYVHSAKITTQT